MIQPLPQNPSPKPASNLRGMRMVILSLAVMTVGGGMVLFVYALSKAQNAMKTPSAMCEMADITLPAGGDILSITPSAKQLEVVLKQTDVALVLQIDRCSGEVTSQQRVHTAE